MAYRLMPAGILTLKQVVLVDAVCGLFQISTFSIRGAQRWITPQAIR